MYTWIWSLDAGNPALGSVPQDTEGGTRQDHDTCFFVSYHFTNHLHFIYLGYAACTQSGRPAGLVRVGEEMETERGYLGKNRADEILLSTAH